MEDNFPSEMMTNPRDMPSQFPFRFSIWKRELLAQGSDINCAKVSVRK